jgi:hypothetical protein
MSVGRALGGRQLEGLWRGPGGVVRLNDFKAAGSQLIDGALIHVANQQQVVPATIRLPECDRASERGTHAGGDDIGGAG